MCSHFLSSVFSLLSVVYIFHLNFPGILIKIIVFVCVNTSCLDYNTANFLKNHQYALKAQELFKKHVRERFPFSYGMEYIFISLCLSEHND